jgi:hypothetical protein
MSNNIEHSDSDSISRPSRTGNPAALLLAGAAIGAAIAYLFDPNRGAKRRAVLRDQVASQLRSAARGVNSKARDVTHHAKGVVAEARANVAGHAVGDDQLADRVRAALGHHVDHVRPIDVFAEGGHVVLRGRVPEREIQAAVSAASSVRGVIAVENRLEPVRHANATEPG